MSKSYSISVRIDNANKKFFKKLEKEHGGITKAIRYLIATEKHRQTSLPVRTIGDVFSVKTYQLLHGLLANYHADSGEVIKASENESSKILEPLV